ncbi:MAG TPA: hypothetical protein PK174_02685 [Anaerolineaceae bacterium]|nr:hypothetical protein [Anaerolineaceae bacterium]
MMNKSIISSRQLITLSVYLDGQLTITQKARLEKQLSESAELRHALHELRRTRNVLRQLKQKPAPRNFMLKPDMVSSMQRAAPVSRWVPVLSFGSVAAAILMIFTLVAGLLPMGMRAAQPALEYAAAPVIEAPVTAEEDTTAPLPIISWGNGDAEAPGVVAMGGIMATGKGGGGGGAEGAGGSGVGSGGAVISAPPAVITNDMGVPCFVILIPPAPGEGVQAESRDVQKTGQEDNFTVIDSGPILGLRITEEVQKPAEPKPEPASKQTPAFSLPAAIIFGAAAILLALSAILLKRKQQN